VPLTPARSGGVMKIVSLSLLLVLIFQGAAFPSQDMIDFRLAYDRENKDTVLFHDKDVGPIYVEKKSALKPSDLKRASVVIRNEKLSILSYPEVQKALGPPPHPLVYIKILFSNQGTDKLAKITSANIGNRLAIFVNHEFIAAPKILDAITDGKAMITTAYTQDEAKDIVKKINEQIKTD
jgi:preprotein translocase subunit SecD